MKLVSDGSISGGSAGLEDPFLGNEDHRLLVFGPEEPREICVDVGSRGLVVADGAERPPRPGPIGPIRQSLPARH